jgi:hypothetical protein
MTVSLAPYRVSAGEKPLSSVKQNNSIAALEGALNHLPPSQIIGYPGDSAKYLDGSGQWSVPGVGPVGSPPIPYVKTTTTDVVSTTSFADLFGGAFTLPINSLSATGCIRIWAGGDFLNNSGSVRGFSLQLSYAGVVFWQAAVDGQGVSTTRKGWHFEAALQALGGSSVYGSGSFFLSQLTGPFVVGLGSLSFPANGINRMAFGSFATITNAAIQSAVQPLLLNAAPVFTHPSLSVRCLYARVEVTH